MVGRCELKCAPDDVSPENLKDVRVCDKHYSVYQQEGINLLGGKAPLDHPAMPSGHPLKLHHVYSCSDLFTMWQHGLPE